MTKADCLAAVSQKNTSCGKPALLLPFPHKVFPLLLASTGDKASGQYDRNISMFVKFKAENIQYHRKSSAQPIVAAASGGGNGELSGARLNSPLGENMKKKGRSINVKIYSTVLYLDDIRYLVELLEKEVDEISVKVEDKFAEYEFNSSSEIENLRNLPNNLFNNLTITTFRPYSNIYLNEFSGRIYISEDTPLLRGLMEKIRERLNLRRRKFFWVTANPLFPTVTFIYGIFLLSKSNYFIPLTIVILSVIWCLLGGYYLRFKSYTILFNNCRNEMPSFFKRNRDNIFLVIISAIIGAVLTLVITKLF